MRGKCYNLGIRASVENGYMLFYPWILLLKRLLKVLNCKMKLTYHKNANIHATPTQRMSIEQSNNNNHKSKHFYSWSLRVLMQLLKET